MIFLYIIYTTIKMIRKCNGREKVSYNPRSSFLLIKDIQPVHGTGSVANSQLGSSTLPCCIGSAGQEKTIFPFRTGPNIYKDTKP
jgi:hypothetical protein